MIGYLVLLKQLVAFLYIQPSHHAGLCLMMAEPVKIVVTGAAGLVGQNLIPRLEASGYTKVVAIDKHPANTSILRQLNPRVSVIEADLATADGWQSTVADTDIVIVAHAQIGGLNRVAFVANNVTATHRLINAVRANNPYIVYIGSSVVEAAAEDLYTQTKREQERIIWASGLPSVILRPTLMFGRFDRKHIGWLARFMHKTPVFPIPGHGHYPRQPLYCRDFCEIVISCIIHRPSGAAYNISGQEKIDYLDLMLAVRDACQARTAIIRVPYAIFWGLLQIYAKFDQDPPFTAKQLEALVASDTFEVIDWPRIFGVNSTPLGTALRETFRDPVYSKIVLEF
jgi:nucleoside-diphosphate-sugar epimerase